MHIDELIKSIADRFCPYFLFNQGEDYHPARIEHVLKGNDLRRKNGEKKEAWTDAWNQWIASGVASDEDDRLEFSPSKSSNTSDSALYYLYQCAGRPNKNSPPQTVMLQFMIWYEYNPQPGFGIASHEGDWERVVVVVNRKPGATGSIASDFELSMIALSGHDSEDVHYRDSSSALISFYENTHPKVYVSKGGHANYRAPGRYHSSIDEAFGKGHQWAPWKHNAMVYLGSPDVALDVSDPSSINKIRWWLLKYNGTWGNQSGSEVTNPRSRNHVITSKKYRMALPRDNGVYMMMVHEGSGTNRLYTSLFSGSILEALSGQGATWSWSKDTWYRAVGTTCRGPALCVFDGKLYCVHRGPNGDTKLYFYWYDGEEFIGDIELGNNAKSDEAPALAVYNNRLYLVYRGESEQLYYCWLERGAMKWSGQHKIDGVKSAKGPSLAVKDGLLHMVHRGTGGEELWHRVYNGGGWKDFRSGGKTDNGGKTSQTPCLVYNPTVDKLFIIHRGTGRDELWYCQLNDDNRWTKSVELGQNSKTTRGPGCCAFPQDLYMVHRGTGNSDIWFSQYSSNTKTWSPNVKMENKKTSSEPRIIAFSATKVNEKWRIDPLNLEP